MEERCHRAEDRARKADERARRSEEQQEDIKLGAEGSRRRQQEDTDNVRKMHQQQDGLRLEAERMKCDYESMRSEVARIAGEAEQARRHLAEEANNKRRASQQQEADRLTIDRLRDDLRMEREARNRDLRQEREAWGRELQLEREARQALEAQCAAGAASLAQATKAAEDAKQAAKELREKNERDVSSLHRALGDIEVSTKARVEGLEMQMNNCYRDTLQRMSLPERIMYYGRSHSQAVGALPPSQTGEQGIPFLTGKENGTRALGLRLAGDVVGDKASSLAFKPLMRRMA